MNHEEGGRARARPPISGPADLRAVQRLGCPPPQHAQCREARAQQYE